MNQHFLWISYACKSVYSGHANLCVFILSISPILELTASAEESVKNTNEEKAQMSRREARMTMLGEMAWESLSSAMRAAIYTSRRALSTIGPINYALLCIPAPTFQLDRAMQRRMCSHKPYCSYKTSFA